MTARQWLNRAWNVSREIESLKRTRLDVLDRLTKNTPNYTADPVQGTSDPHKFDSLADVATEIDRQEEKLCFIMAETLAAIGLLNNSVYRQILKERYIDMLRFEAISLNIHYSYKQTRRLHAKAVAALEGMEGMPWS